MVKIITSLESEKIREALEGAFFLAKEHHDMDLMVDIAEAAKIFSALEERTVEDVIE